MSYDVVLQYVPLRVLGCSSGHTVYSWVSNSIPTLSFNKKMKIHVARLPRVLMPLMLSAVTAFALSDGFLNWLSRPVAVPVALFLAVKLQQAGAF